MKTLISGALAALALTGSAQAAQLLTNGDFDAGNTGFYSAYAYAANHDLWGEGRYDTVRNPNRTHYKFRSMADHTPGEDYGRMMVINGAPGADTVVWGAGDMGGGSSLDGMAGSAFSFSFWLAMVTPLSPANLQLWVNGEKVAGVTFAALGGAENVGVWRQYGYAGVAGAAGLRSIGLTNNNLAPYGNDFALDDMSLIGTLTPPPPPPVLEPPPQSAPQGEVSAAPEPAAWALMILGFGAVGAALRRRGQFAESAATSQRA